MSNNKVRVAKYKHFLYGFIAAIMFAIPFYYYETLKDTPNIGFNNTETDLFQYVVISFFSVFFVLGLVFILLALKRKEKEKAFILKTKVIRILEIITTVCVGITLGYFIKFYNAVVFFLLIPSVVFFLLTLLQNFNKKTYKRLITYTCIICMFFLSIGGFLTYLIVESNIQYKNQDKFLDDFLKGVDVKYNEYGGWDNYPQDLGTFEATGFFHVTKQNGRHWFVDPSGKPFISKGVNHVSINANHYYRDNIAANKYANNEEWATSAIETLKSAGFNTITPWSSPEVRNNQMPFTLLMDFGDTFGRKNNWGYFGDYFEESFLTHVDDRAELLITPYADSPLLLGIFTDNELSWGRDWRNIYNHIQLYINFDNPSAGKKVLIDFLEEKLHNVAAFNTAFGVNISSFNDLYDFSPDKLNFNTELALDLEDEFGGMVAEKYAVVTNDALIKYAPNHLNLGCRFAFYPNETVVTKISQHSDVLSFAGYSDTFSYTFGGQEALNNLYEKLDKPFLIGEYGVRALDANMPNFLYSGTVVINQKQRAATVSKYVEDFMYKPYAVGYHWFQYTDNNQYGLLNGENYGLINKNGETYDLFIYMVLRTNNSLEIMHSTEERKVNNNTPKLWG